MVAILIAQLTKCKIHVLHMGQGRYMHRYVKRAKEEGQAITGELESTWLTEIQTDPIRRKWLEAGNYRAGVQLFRGIVGSRERRHRRYHAPRTCPPSPGRSPGRREECVGCPRGITFVAGYGPCPPHPVQQGEKHPRALIVADLGESGPIGRPLSSKGSHPGRF